MSELSALLVVRQRNRLRRLALLPEQTVTGVLVKRWLTPALVLQEVGMLEAGWSPSNSDMDNAPFVRVSIVACAPFCRHLQHVFLGRRPLVRV